MCGIIQISVAIAVRPAAFRKNYVANCRGVSNNIQLNTFRDGRGQIIFSGSPADVFELQSSGPNNGSEAFVGDGLEVDFDRSSATLSLQRRGQPDTVDCSLQANRPETPAGTQATRLKIDETGSAGGITITLNNIIADNRCPVDAVCVQEGQFAVNTTLETNDLLEQPNLRSGDKGYMFANRRVAVVRVLPPQISNRKIKDDDYLVTFWVTNGE